MKYLKLLLISISTLACTTPKSDVLKTDYLLSVVDIQQVVLTDNFWRPKISTIQDSSISYAFEKCAEEGRMENFLIAGKVKEGTTHGYMPFDDTDLYKIIEGASNSLISKPNPVLETYLDSVIEIIRIGQEPDGYLTTWFTIDRKNPPAPWVEPSEERWENEISSHELYNSGHLFEAAATHYWATGKRNFLNIALKNADLLVDNFGPDKLQIPPGHQIIETGLIKLYRITKNEAYLDLAKLYLDMRGDSTSRQLYGEYSQDHLPVVDQEEAVGHAVRAVYMYAAMTDIAAIYKDSAYYWAVMDLWGNVVSRKMYLTGGVGSKHEGEAFGENYELPNRTAYNETCAAIGNVYWNQRLFLLSGQAKYYDVIERTLYNGLISGISLNGKNFFYPNPLESDADYKFNQGSCTRSPWFDCSCCPTNLIRFIPSIPGLIYATKEDNLFVNLYIANKSKVEINNQEIELEMETDYPWKGRIVLTVNPNEKTDFTLKLRVPGWVRNEVLPSNLYSYHNIIKSTIQLSINGQEQSLVINEGYVEIKSEWNKGDKVEFFLPMNVRKVRTNENVAENIGKVAFEYGPIVYCAEEIDNPGLKNISVTKQDSLQVIKTSILSENVNVLKGNASGEKLKLIPYYLWSNRGENEMRVWFPLTAP